jgi:ABC-type sugar transport system substrate-binding protein
MDIRRSGILARIIAGPVLAGALCAGAAGPAAAKEVTVCFVTFSLQVPFFQASVKGGQEEAKAKGATLIVQDPQADAQRQVTQMEDCIARQVSAIVVDAVESGAITGAIEDAARQGIKTIAIDAPINHPDVISNIGVSNFTASREFGQYLAGYIMAKYNGAARIGVMLASTKVQLARRDGLIAALKAVPKSSIVATGDGRNILERASNEAEDMLTAHPDINVIYATGDPQLQGALAAAASRPNMKIDFFGWDDIPAPFVKPLEEGRIVGFTTQLPAQQGQLGVRYAIDAVNGKPVPKTVDSPVEIVTKDNLSSYK